MQERAGGRRGREGLEEETEESGGRSRGRGSGGDNTTNKQRTQSRKRRGALERSILRVAGHTVSINKSFNITVKAQFL